MRVHKSVLALSAGHFFIDKYSSMLGAFLPFLHRELNVTLSQAGILGGALVVSSALMQPLYGYLADRFQHKVFAALAPAVAGVFISSLGIAPGFWFLLLFLVLGGVGIAAFHPQGAALTSEADRTSQGYQMSVFITCGMIGYALGPVFITGTIGWLGLERSYWAALPGVLVSLYLFRYGPSPRRVEVKARRSAFTRQLREKIVPLTMLYFIVVIRSAIQIVFVSFLPLYFTLRGFTESQASQQLTLFLLVGGTAGFLGGVLADRFGGRNIIAISMFGTLPLLMGFLWTEGPLSMTFCVLGGGFLLFTTPVNVVMAQRLVPEGASTVSALMMGFGWGMGGLLTPLVGLLSDVYSMQLALSMVVLLALPGLLLALALPARTARPSLEPVHAGKVDQSGKATAAGGNSIEVLKR